MSEAPDQPDQNTARSTDGGRSWVKPAVQVVGFGVCVALLVWTISEALSAENRQQLARLGDARAWQVALLALGGIATVLLNGLIFWAVIGPVKRLRALDVVAVNAVATLLAYLPFKLSVVARVAIHRRRDGVPLLTIGAWFAAMAALLLATLVPAGGASLLLKDISPLWAVAVVSGVFAANGIVIMLSRLVEGERGMTRLMQWSRVLRSSSVDRALSGRRFAELHAGLTMTGDIRGVLTAAALRLADAGVHAVRFWIAAQVLGVPLGLDGAVMLGFTFFLIGVLSPFGSLGAREGGTLAIAELIGLGVMSDGSNPVPALILFVSGTESVVALAAAGFGAAWLRLDKLLRFARPGAALGEGRGER